MVTLDWDDRLSAPLAVGQDASAASAPVTLGPEALLESWFRDYFERLWRLVARLGVAPHCIDDIVQDTFITANRRQADIREGREWSFLVGTAVRLSA
ncbi:MAG TPA: hypothetical protein VMG12_06500, partial [Polyangiaceae bacterium]|nr:hypothetical protein [Polyangiaceae bacterium]